MQISTFCLSWKSNPRFKKLIKVIKLTTLLIFISLMHVSAASIAQRIQLNKKNIAFEKLFKELEKQTGYTILYTNSAIKDLPNVDIEINDATIDEVLNKCFENKPLEYFKHDNSIVIRRKETTVINNAQQIKANNELIQGKVTDQRGDPLVGVTIREVGTNYGWTTDAKGEFTALIVTKGGKLQFSFIGFVTQEVLINNIKSPLLIVLKEDIGKLDAVQVIAYGQTTKRVNTGDQTTITAKEIEKYPVNNVLSVLQGTVPGMVITQNSGMPGSTYSVNIRGQNGRSTGTEPFYVVDGVPYEGGSFGSQRSTLGRTANSSYNSLSFINPLDIESINVLKDADATAIYGSRAANGVLLITTKKGKAGAPKFDINVYQGISRAQSIPELLSTREYLQMRREAKRNNNNQAIFPTDNDINGKYDTTRYSNYPKIFMGGTGHTTNAQASVSGGNDNVQYLVSGNYRQISNIQEIIGGTDKTASVHFNINSTSLNKKFNVGFTGGYTYNWNNIPNVDLASNATLAPNSPDFLQTDGSINNPGGIFNGNPYYSRNLIGKMSAANLTSSLVLAYKLFDGFSLQATMGYNRQNVNEFNGLPLSASAPSPFVTTASSTFTYNTNTYWSVEPQAVYTRNILKGVLTATVGSSLQKRTLETLPLAVTGYASDLLIESPTAGTLIKSNTAYAYETYKFNAGFGRLNYIWDDKYIVNVSGRYDGSSRFGADRQFHLFGSVGGAWVFSAENFVKDNLKFISFGKLRASYGVTGNDQIPYNQYLENYFSSTFPYQGIPGLFPGNIANPQLSWESTAKKNFGAELQFFNGRIGIEGNYYINLTSDILANNPASTVTGFSGVYQNMPIKIQNKGFDLTLNTVNIASSRFRWSSTFLFTRQRNKLKEYPGLPPAQSRFLNNAINAVNVFISAGVDPQTGLYQFVNNAGGVTSTPVQGLDDTKLIDLNPDFFGAVSNTFTYKGFSLSFLVRYVNQIGSNAFGQTAGFPVGILPSNWPRYVLNRWQKPGDVTTVARYSTGFGDFTSNNAATRSDLAFGDASYMRLQNASIGYQFPFQAVQKWHMQNLRIYAQGENLLTISKYGTYDPENQSSLRMAPLRTITVGMQITL
jgi:TonB-linked SusC/RagA family outer membrane protein